MNDRRNAAAEIIQLDYRDGVQYSIYRHHRTKDIFVFDHILCSLKYVLVCRHEMVAVRIQNTVVQICLRAYLMLPRSRHRVSIYGRGRERERMRVLALGGSL